MNGYMYKLKQKMGNETEKLAVVGGSCVVVFILRLEDDVRRTWWVARGAKAVGGPADGPI